MLASTASTSTTLLPFLRATAEAVRSYLDSVQTYSAWVFSSNSVLHETFLFLASHKYMTFSCCLSVLVLACHTAGQSRIISWLW